MASEDPFTSIKWDRDDGNKAKKDQETGVIPEEGLPEVPDNEEPGQLALESDQPVETSTLASREPQVDEEQFQEQNEGGSTLESTAEARVMDTTSSPSSTPHGCDLPEVADKEEPKLPVPTEDELRQDELRQQELSEAFDKFTIDSSVSHPISDKDASAKQFISYLITTTTDHPSVTKLSSVKSDEGSETVTVKIRRRYGDFRFLHNCLINDFPQSLVPPLPPKSNFKYLTGDTFSTAFVHKRLHSLNTFIRFICQHRYLSQSSVFHHFISDSSEWSTFTKNLSVSKNASPEEAEGTGFMGKVVNEDLLTETVMNFFTSSKHKRETNKDILEISDKLKKLYENLIKLDKIFGKLNRKHSDLKLDYEQFSVQINKLATIQNVTTHANENSKVDPNKSLNSLSGDIPVFQNNFKVFSDSLLFFSEHWSSLHRYVDESFLVSLKDCAKYIIRFTELIELQHNKKIDLQVLQDYLVKARADLASLGGAASGGHGPAPTPVMVSQQRGLVNNTTQLIKDTISTSATPHIGSTHSDSKRFKLQQRVSQLESEIKSQTQLVNHLTNRIINEEYPNWDRFNKKLLKKSMVELCDQEIDFYKKLADNWGDVESKLIMRLEELS
ncbi:hypothetical protein FT663_04873 [Candidozyma haemuli var. vulneris]|uniref:Sorting nexin-4 n=1 Tax=Candidozyma haemuli TaxID=45357 RepID=A0A2V1AWF0_9ASCO|nr:hypothetical protein CXQ85_004801 [[Candida] haemuloni]KAF3986284.1 hypothetical protein FT662_04651 [[Candida] haemuloni var. vulneris]KAF3986463.1 hypothetical protein FT663_04873 [[Candida] haemuloni var. vulneris]PVH22132.1 hypothetical protein CXQ85_004801 [[Candida] haemuloni]